MNYFDPYAFAADKSIVTAWDSEVARVAQTPWLAEALARTGGELFPSFADCYAQLRASPRGARRALQRQLARSQELAAILPEWLYGQAGHALQQKLARSLAGTALLLALGQGVAQANTINVTPKTPPGITLGDGKCSLSEAIISANNDIAYDACSSGLGADTIVLPKGTQSLTYAFPNFLGIGPTGLPVITSDITIDGNRAKITRANSVPEMRLMAVSTGGTLTLNDVTMSGGSAIFGGAIYNKGSFLRINRTTITGNKAVSGGGGIFSYQGNVNINNSTISKNAADGLGGGLSNFDGYIRVDNSTISKNSSGGLGGGVLNLEGAIRIGNNSTISKNSARAGGGLWNNEYMSVTDSIITGNKAGDRGGGAYNYRNTLQPTTLRIYATTISKNSAMDDGGGLWNRYGDIDVANSIITGNKAGDRGGGAYNNDGALIIDPTTISKNSAKYGGGICNIDGDLRLYNSTVTGNKASVSGGGVLDVPSPFVNSGNTFSKNKAPNGPDTAYSF